MDPWSSHDVDVSEAISAKEVKAYVEPSGSRGFDKDGLGYVLACADHKQYFHRYAALGNEEGKALGRQAESNVLTSQAMAHARACRVVAALGADPNDVFVLCRQRANRLHFGINLKGVRYGCKTRQESDASLWAEKEWAVWAHTAGFGVEVLDEESQPNVLMTRWISDALATHDAMASFSARQAFLRRLRQMHTCAGLRPPAGPAGWVGGAEENLAQLKKNGVEGPLDVNKLKIALDKINTSLASFQPRIAVTHGDVTLPNILVQGDQVYFLDWETAGWGDPFLDLARLISSSAWHNGLILIWLSAYLSRMPNLDEIKHLSLLITAFDIDYYSHVRRCSGPKDALVMARAERLSQANIVLDDIQEILWSPKEMFSR